MYTQCPECEVAFRVTADVLKQAAGKVRCGGCGVAFNALAHLSENMPANAAQESSPGEAAAPPRSISAEQSAALLKTLDQLAGDDVRIEDTGVEWRVIDAEEDADIADDPVPGKVEEEMRFDDNTPLPDDFDLDTPAAPRPPPEPIIEPEPEPQLEASQVDLVFGEPDEWEDLLGDLDEVAAELKNATPDTADEIEVIEAIPVEEDSTEADTGASEFVDDAPEALDMDAQFARQAEVLGLDLTGLQKAVNADAVAEESEPVEDTADEFELEDEHEDEDDLAVVVEEPEPDKDAGDEFELEDVPDAEDEDEIDYASDVAADHDDADDPGETSIEEDLIAAAFEVEAAARAKAEPKEADIDVEAGEPANEHDEINLEDVAPEELSRAGILDEDDYLEPISEEDEAAVLDEIELEASPADRALAEAVFDEVSDGQDDDQYIADAEESAEAESDEPREALPDEPAAEDISEAQPEDDLLDDHDLADEAQLPDEAELAAQLETALDGIDDVEYAEPDDVDVPELTAEEKSVNMMIDQDLLAIAVEDDDGFTSTIVQKQVSDATDIPEEKPADSDDEAAAHETDEAAVAEAANDDAATDEDGTTDTAAQDDDNAAAAMLAAAADNPLMETIIMEGESVMNEQDQERLEAARAAASESLKKAGFDEEKARFSLRDWRPPPHSMAAAAALLFVILIVQVIHHSREALAVSPAFQNTIGPVYSMLGSPVTPAWDISGWRFEATKGSTDDGSNVLTIYSRVGNNSEQALPYPLIHVELKDRFEEIVGSKVLEPAEYLVDDADPDRSVPPKETFNAIIAIDSPSAAATSFKLNVCYGIGGGKLRCDDKDFR